MSNLREIDKQLVPFLKDLTESIESNKLSQEQLQCVGEFFISYKSLEEKNIQTNEEDDFDSMDIIKFITLGWYIYKVLLSEQKNQDTIEDETKGDKV